MFNRPKSQFRTKKRTKSPLFNDIWINCEVNIIISQNWEMAMICTMKILVFYGFRCHWQIFWCFDYLSYYYTFKRRAPNRGLSTGVQKTKLAFFIWFWWRQAEAWKLLLAGAVSVNALARRALRRFTKGPWIEGPTFQLRGGHSNTELSPPQLTSCVDRSERTHLWLSQ